MMRWSFVGALGAAAIVGVVVLVACSSDENAADGAGCPSGKKSCAGHCVAIDDPAYGCDTEGCAACVPANANQFSPRCENHACLFDFCQAPAAHCDTSKPLGCE